MVNKWVTRAELAELSGVTASGATRACQRVFPTACQGKRVDLAHPDVVKWLEKRSIKGRKSATESIDPLYEDTLRVCRKANRFTVNFIRERMNIGSERARAILGVMAATKQIPEGARVTSGKTRPEERALAWETEPEQELPPEKPHIRGYAAANERKKREPSQEEKDRAYMSMPQDIREFHDMPLLDVVTMFGTDVAFVDWLKATKVIEDIAEKRLKNAATKGELVSRDLVRVGILDPVQTAHTKLLTDGVKTIATRVVAMHGAKRPQGEIEKFVADQITSFIKPMKARISRTMKRIED